MKLGTWLETNKITQQAFAELIGSSQPQVARFAAGTRIPNPDTMRQIVAVTKGAVDPRDFYAMADEAAAAE